MSNLYTAEAIVLKTKDFRENDKLVTLFSPYQGKISCIVKGVKKPSSKLSGVVQSFMYGNYQFYPGKNLQRLVQGSIIHGFGDLRNDFTKMSAGMCILEYLDKTIPEQEEYSSLFGVTLSCFHLLEKDHPASLVLRIFEAKLIDSLGYYPNLSDCMNHGEIPESTKRFFDPDCGGLVCESCFQDIKERYEKSSLFPVEQGSMVVIKKLLDSPVYQLRRLKLTDLQNETVERIFTGILSNHAGIICKAKSFYKTMV